MHVHAPILRSTLHVLPLLQAMPVFPSPSLWLLFKVITNCTFSSSVVFVFFCFHCPFSYCDSCTLPHSIVKARGGFRNENKGTRVCVEAHRRGALTGTGRTRLPSSHVFILIVLFLSIQRLLYEFEIIFIVRRKWVSMKGGNRERNSGEYVEF